MNIKLNSFLQILIIILAGEAIFLLPFVLARVFRPTFLDVFQISNTELGSCFSIYGIVALISYLLGGFIADKFAPSKLMAVALFLTGLGGLYLATIPDLSGLQLVYGAWGFSTIFLFWAALIKATRSWGGNGKQGLAFGFLDGGRGFVAAAVSSFGILLFANTLELDPEDRIKGFQQVIYLTSAFVFAVGLACWFFIKTDDSQTKGEKFSIQKGFELLGSAKLWLYMIIILCAYSGYKTSDDFSLYASDVLKFDEIDSSWVASLTLYTRPIIGIGLGLLADRGRASTLLALGFGIMLASGALLATNFHEIAPSALTVLLISACATGIFSCRVLYFALLEEGRIPLTYTGTAVGLISVVGFTPDIFMGPLMGNIIDNNPGIEGHKMLFTVFCCFALLGMIAALIVYRIHTREEESTESVNSGSQ